jgi:adenosylcobinamide-GDP ribazoletransferase
LPVGRFAAGPAPDATTLVALPLVGAVVGALAGLLGYGFSFVLPHALAAALALGAVIVLTGAIHVDGFLDGCDAFIATVSPERRLEILKDPRHGTFAVAGMFVAGTIWYASLAAIAPARYPAILAFAGALARAAAVPNAFVFPYARGGAVARAFVSRPAIVPLATIVIALVIAAFELAPAYVAIVPVAIALSLLLGRSIARRLGGGLVGDAYGFIIVIVEIVVLAVVAGAGSYGE